MNDKDQLFKKLNYSIKNMDLLDQAFKHKSLGSNVASNNERLEFLGDSILNVCIVELLYKTYPDYKEGQMTKIKSQLVSTKTLVEIAKNLELEKYLQTKNHNNAITSKTLAGTFEAILASIYLDAGFETVQMVIRHLYKKQIENFVLINYKSDLQEFIQKNQDHGIIPEYKIVKTEGPDHDKTFYVDVYLNGGKLASGVGSSKKEAEEKAAQKALFGLSDGSDGSDGKESL